MTFRDEYIEACTYLFGGRKHWRYLATTPVRDYRFFASFFSTSKRALAVLAKLEDIGVVEIREEETPEFKACLEKAKFDKRVKNPKTYCLRKHPINIRIKVNYEALESFWEAWEKEGRPLTFYTWLLYQSENTNA